MGIGFCVNLGHLSLSESKLASLVQSLEVVPEVFCIWTIVFSVYPTRVGGSAELAAVTWGSFQRFLLRSVPSSYPQ